MFFCSICYLYYESLSLVNKMHREVLFLESKVAELESKLDIVMNKEVPVQQVSETFNQEAVLLFIASIIICFLIKTYSNSVSNNFGPDSPPGMGGLGSSLNSSSSNVSNDGLIKENTGRSVCEFVAEDSNRPLILGRENSIAAGDFEHFNESGPVIRSIQEVGNICKSMETSILDLGKNLGHIGKYVNLETREQTDKWVSLVDLIEHFTLEFNDVLDRLSFMHLGNLNRPPEFFDEATGAILDGVPNLYDIREDIFLLGRSIESLETKLNLVVLHLDTNSGGAISTMIESGSQSL